MTNKRAHEQAKKDRAEAKRARRETRARGEAAAAATFGTDDVRTEAQWLEHLQYIQDAFGRDDLSFEVFDAERTNVLNAIDALKPDNKT